MSSSGTDAPDHVRKIDANFLRCGRRCIEMQIAREQFAQQRHVVLRGHRYAVEDHDGLDLAVENRRENCVFDAADENRLVDRCVFDAPQTADFLGELRETRGRRRRDEQRLEVGAPFFAAVEGLRQTFGREIALVGGRVPLSALVAIAAREERAAHAAHESRDADRVTRGDTLADRVHEPRARIGEEVLERAHVGQCLFDRSTRITRIGGAGARGPRLRFRVELAPAIESGRRACEKAVHVRDCPRRRHGIGSLFSLPPARCLRVRGRKDFDAGNLDRVA